jgi:WD40 repeat protein
VLAPVSWWEDLGERVSCSQWSPDGSLLAVGSLGGDARVYCANGEQIAAPVDNELGVLCLGWSPDGAHLARGGQDARVTIWDAEHGRCTQVDQRDWVNALSWAPDPMAPALAVAAGVDVALYRPDGGLVAELAFQPGTVNALAWAGEPPRLAAGCRGGVRWLGIAEGEQADAFPSAGAPLALLPDPGGRLLTAADLSGSLHLWDLRCEDHAELQGYPDPVELLAWDGPGSRLAAVAGDEITVWSVASDHDELVVGDQPVVLHGHDERITDIVFRPGGTLLASAGADGALVLWDPATTDNALGRLEFGVELSRCAWRPGTGTIAVGTATGRVGVVELWPGG